MNLNREICNSFNKYANNYDKFAKIQKEIGQRLFERLSYLTLKPQYILDLGCGTGTFTRLLAQNYTDATVSGVDFAQKMLINAYGKQDLNCKWFLVNANMLSLPFADNSIDLIFANQVLHWSSSWSELLGEIHRVLREGGCLMFATLGPDSFKELIQAGSQVHSYSLINEFIDMHLIGDQLLSAQFGDIVMDMEMITVHYDSVAQLLSSLKAQGVRNIHKNRNLGLMGKHIWANFVKILQNFMSNDNKYPLTYEVIYGHAWKKDRKLQQSHETYIPISEIRK